MRKLFLILGILAAGTLLAGTLPVGTTVRVRLQQSLNSGTAKSGQGFTAVLDEPLVVDGKTVAAKGANVKGIVSRAVPSGRLKTPAELYLRLSSVEVGGKSYPLQTSSVGRRGESHKKRDTIAIGGGSALGAIIGGIAGGGKGAAIGAGAGAAAGTGGAYATGKKNIEYAVETPLTFKLRQPATIP
jgi:hypothetical protein